MLNTGEAEFFFIANDATTEVIEHLNVKGYKYYINNNPCLTEQELFNKGIGCPEYINRVYRGWNAAIQHAKDVVVLVNSDNIFSTNWLENLYKHLNEKVVVCSQLIERRHPKYGVFPGAYEGNFGNHPSNFQKELYLDFCKRVSKNMFRYGGAYMPCMFYRHIAFQSGLYPEGNICGKSFNQIVRYGDEDFFLRLQNNGVQHITSMDSISYHFKEGEMES